MEQSDVDIQNALTSIGVTMRTAEQVERDVELEASAALETGISTVASLAAVEHLLEAVVADIVAEEATVPAPPGGKHAPAVLSGMRAPTRLDRLKMKARLLEMLRKSRIDTDELDNAEDWIAGGVSDKLGEELNVVVDDDAVTPKAAARDPGPAHASSSDSDDIAAMFDEEESDVEPVAPSKRRKYASANSWRCACLVLCANRVVLQCCALQEGDLQQR